MQSRQACRSLMFSFFFLLPLAFGCVTSPGTNSEATVSDGIDPSLEGDDNVPVVKNEKLVPGPVEDIDLKEVVYQGAEKQLSATEDDNTRVEIGDFESFKFSITKMTKGGDDVTNQQAETPDRIFVEFTGWFKRSAKNDEESEDKCFSFDATATLNAEGESWTYDDKLPLKLSRENSEDCY